VIYPQYALAVFAGDAGAALGDMRKDQYARGLFCEIPVRRVKRKESVQRPVGAGIELRLAVGERRGARDQRENGDAGS